MSNIRPFKALRPQPELAAQVSSVPYDVIYENEVREVLSKDPLSLLRVTRPDGDLPASPPPTKEQLNAQAKHNLDEMISNGTLIYDAEEAIYIYQLSTENHTQTGIVAVSPVEDYDNGHIKRHERTRPDKVEDRTSHILTVGAQTGLIFLAFRGTDETRRLIENATKGQPLYTASYDDGVKHTIWRDVDTAKWIYALSGAGDLYIADGHHRAESASLARKKRRKSDPKAPLSDFDYVIAGMFPAEDLKIMAYNRAVKDLNSLTHDQVIQKISETFIVTEVTEKVPDSYGQICMYLGGKWYGLKYNVAHLIDPGPIESLDVSILQNNILAPILGIDDPRTDERIAFVGGIRGVEELEKMVDSGNYAVAFSMYPTTMDDLFAVADIGEIMPPKSTWFEPKLRDGFLIHQI